MRIKGRKNKREERKARGKKDRPNGEGVKQIWFFWVKPKERREKVYS